MPPGKRRTGYTAEDVQLAVNATKEDGLSLRQASELFNVPKSTIKDHLDDDHSSNMGRPTVLSAEEEVQLLEKIQVLADWGFPLTGQDVCHFVKSYLDKKGVRSSRFKDNLPTSKWITCFLKRHPEFCLRKVNPIKRTRAAVSREDISDFFINYSEAVEGVPPENLYNCDETNFKDDPGSSKCMVKKGTKYVEKVLNTSKQATSVMLCGNAAKEWLPPMVVYRAMNIYSSWCERGPKGAVYSASKSGWFDGYQYEKWFFEIFLPPAKKKKGKKLLVCDNLSCHISAAVIESCRQEGS
jgi:hypothetical protein